jgi:hypothetical protein
MKYRIIVLLVVFQGISLQAQKFAYHPEPEEPRNKGKAILLHVSFGAQLPGGDLANRFGGNGVYGGGVDFMTANNFFIGFEGQGLFGQKVKDDPLSILRTPEGSIIGNDRALSRVLLRERGVYLGATIGKLLTFQEARKGVRIALGAGWLEHSIQIQDDDRTLTQLTGDYSKGYDRLVGGLAFNEFVGWQILGKLKRSNFMIGFECSQGFTQTRRDWDFSEMRKLEGKRLDLRFGIKAAWTIPFYIGNSSELFY